MKRWAILTVFLYALALLVLTAPIVLIAFANWGLKNDNVSFKDALSLYTNWAYWIWLAVLSRDNFYYCSCRLIFPNAGCRRAEN
jgi:hypothetical protein